MPERETTQLFDLTLKRLLSASNQAIVHFVNGLFGTDYSTDSAVDYPLTEYISASLRRQMLDVLLLINKTDLYHIEAQIDDDENMAIRVFDYGYAVGLRHKRSEGDVIHVKFPNARVIYWETSRETPDYVTLRLEFPDGATHDYKVQSFKYLDHDLEYLEKYGSQYKEFKGANEMLQGALVTSIDKAVEKTRLEERAKYEQAVKKTRLEERVKYEQAVKKTRLEEQAKYEQEQAKYEHEQTKYEQRLKLGFRNLLNNGMTPAEVATMFNMPVEDVMKLRML
ncbi:MAG: hypothetical protein LBK98_05365 [Peptococcaceae bacterium]|jgi:hypothetical protein|nr:hypothetical protein [Peptococcaceae bacterium]